MKQTGIIVKVPAPSDYFMGGVSGVERKIINPSGNWKPYLPSIERQSSKDYPFDTMSCVTFSALNFLETLFSYKITHTPLSAEFMKFLRDDGYMDANGKLNFSDRFNAILSGTTDRGNDFATVWNSIRKVGLIPESMFPFGGTTFGEYHDKSKITPAMLAQGQKFLTFIEIMFEWVFFSSDMVNLDISAAEKQLMTEALKESPLHLGSPKAATHAIEGYGMGAATPLIFDTYQPFDVADTLYNRFHFAIKGSIAEKSRVPRTLKKGMKGDDVKQLQNDLNFVLGCNLLADGDFGGKTEAQVIAFQKKYGLGVDGVAGKITLATLSNKVLEKKNLAKNKFKLVPKVLRASMDFIDRAMAKGTPIRITRGFATLQEQADIYAQGRTKPGPIVTNAKPGYSFHNYGVAFDVVFVKTGYVGDWQALGKLGEECGLEWGGRWTSPDRPHFEIKNGHKISDFLNKKVNFKEYD